MNGLYNLGRNKSPWDLEKPFSLSGYSPNMAERGTFDFSDMKPLTELTEPDMAPTTPETTPINPLLGTTSPETKKPTSLLDYWKQPVFGKIPLDQFVRLAGLLGHAIAPETPMGRAGGVLGQMGSQAYAERMKREEEELKYQQEEPDRLLKRRYMEAQIKKLGELKEPTPQYVERIENIGGVDKLVKMEVISGKSYIAGDATEEDKRRIQTGKTKESITKYQKVGETDKGLSLGYDSTTNQYVVTLKDGSIQPFDEKIHGKKVSKEEKVPSLGNIAEIAIGRKFTDPAYLTDPEKHKEALKWLGTDEGSKALKKARDELTAPAVTFLQTAEGFVPVTTRGEGIGTVGKPTGLLPPLSEDLKKDYTAMSQSNDLVGQLKGLWDTLGIGGGTGGRVYGVQLYGEAKLGQNANAKTYLDSRDAFLGNLSRSIAAERGVLTNQDIDRISKAIPKIGVNPLSTDNKEEAEKKWKLVYSIIQNAEKRLKERGEMRKGTLPDVGAKEGLTADDFFKKKGIK